MSAPNPLALAFSCALAFFAGIAPEAVAEEPLLAQIINSQPAIVSVTAENTGWFKDPQQSAALDRSSGRVVVAQKVARASYHRNGAGVIIHPSGVIVTNAHNIKGADHIKVSLPDGPVVAATVVRFIDNLDLALLKIEPPFTLKTITIADSDKVTLGQDIITVGNSPLLKQTVSGGRVTGLGTQRGRSPDGAKPVDLIQTSLNLYKGDSGGPLFDRSGQLIGLMTASETASDHSSFAIPSNKIRFFLDDYLAGLKPKAGAQP